MALDLDDVPPWVLVGVPLGVVAIALLSARKDSGGVSYGAVTAYSPAPVDQGIIALEQSKVEAKAGAFGQIVSILGAEDISRLTSERDVALTRIQADAQNLRTEAERQAALAHENTTQMLGIAGLNAEQALAKINADSALKLSQDQGATAKYIAKKDAQKGIWQGVTNVVGSALSHLKFW